LAQLVSQLNPDFALGVATAAYQIEGGFLADGKGPSIWDDFSNKKGKIYQNQNGNHACRFYEKWEEDVALLKQLHIPNYRFSLSWSRLLPDGLHRVNPKGIEFYNRLIDRLLELGITPWITLYHWDLPYTLEKEGGWTSREVLNWFARYADLVTRHFGDRVKHWMVLNEPMVFTGAGYFMGIHAPGRRGFANFLPAVHHATMAMGEGGRIIQANVPGAEIGTTFSCSWIQPIDEKPANIKAATKVDALLNRLFVEPVLGLGYPTEQLPVLRKMEKYIRPGDLENIPFDFDFMGVQNYTREIVKYSMWTPYLKAKLIPASKRGVPYSEMNWEIIPDSVYHMLKQFGSYPQIKKMMVTESGLALQDKVIDGQVSDVVRATYIKDVLQQIVKAKQEGLSVEGYFAWTFTDNFEWAEGYRPRFGLVHNDFETQKRTVKTSGRWFAALCKQMEIAVLSEKN